MSARARGRPKQRGYLRHATKTFLEGTRCRTPEDAVLRGMRTPEDAVLRGMRTLEEWVDALSQAREMQQVNATLTRGSSLRRAETP